MLRLAIGVGVSILRHAGGQASAEKLVQATDCAADREKKYARQMFKNRIFSHVGVLAYFARLGVREYAEIVLVGNSDG